MAYVAYENGCFVIRENTGPTRVLAGIILESISSYDECIIDLNTAITEYVANHATYEAINPLWIGTTYYSSEPTGAPSGYVCVWEEYTEGDVGSLNSALKEIRLSSRSYAQAVLQAVRVYAKNYFAHCLPQTQQLDTPTDLTATNVTQNSADLGWSNVENASNYRVDYRIYGDTLWQQTTSN